MTGLQSVLHVSIVVICILVCSSWFASRRYFISFLLCT